MIQLKILTLADAGRTREGLLNVLGAGLTHFGRPSYPAPFVADIVLGFENRPPMEEREYLIRVIAHRVDDESLVVVEAEAIMVARTPDTGQGYTIPLVIEGTEFGIPEAGEYVLTVSVDGEVVGDLHFYAVEDAERYAPPA